MVEMQNNLKITGWVKYELFDECNKLIQIVENHNLVVNTGLVALATWLTAFTQANPFMSYIALGTGNTSPSPSDTALETELSGGGYSRLQGTLSSPSSGVLQNVVTFPPGNGTGTLTEAGLFSTVTTGTMFSREVYSPITKGAGNSLVVTWQITFSA